MRTLNLGSSELVEGLITDLRKNDLTLVKNTIELIITVDDVEVAPTSGWAVRDSVQVINTSSIIAGKLHTASEVGFFKLWGQWGVGLENVKILLGRFRVV